MKKIIKYFLCLCLLITPCVSKIQAKDKKVYTYLYITLSDHLIGKEFLDDSEETSITEYPVFSLMEFFTVEEEGDGRIWGQMPDGSWVCIEDEDHTYLKRQSSIDQSGEDWNRYYLSEDGKASIPLPVNMHSFDKEESDSIMYLTDDDEDANYLKFTYNVSDFDDFFYLDATITVYDPVGAPQDYLKKSDEEKHIQDAFPIGSKSEVSDFKGSENLYAFKVIDMAQNSCIETIFVTDVKAGKRYCINFGYYSDDPDNIDELETAQRLCETMFDEIKLK